MTGTGEFPRIDAEPESWTADPSRWPRWRRHLLAGLAALVVFAAAWWWSGDILGGFVVGSSLLVTVLCVVLWVRLGDVQDRLAASDARHTRADQDRADLHLRLTEVSSRQRNHELDRHRDEVAEQRAKRGQT